MEWFTGLDWKAVAQGGLVAAQYFLLFFWAYWLFISFFGISKPKKQKQHDPQKKFLIMVPAHNEEAVISQLTENLMNLDYPKELYEVCVIADGCNDRTAEIARDLGAVVVEHEYQPGEPKGKPYGIRYALDVYGDRLTKEFDGIAFFDADNLVQLNYLKVMNNHLLNGDKLIQCYLDSKNPDDNWVTLSYAASYYYMNRSWQLAKSKIGLGNAIGGTGFCVDTELFDEVGWTARSLTEDLEFTMQALLVGVPAKWAHNTRVFDEKPESFVASLVQRLRWARGHWDVCTKYAPKLLWKSISRFDILAFDGMLYLLNPGKIVLNFLTGLIILFSTVISVEWFVPALPWQIWVAALAYQITYIFITLSVDTNHKLNKVKSFLSIIVFNLSYIPLFVWSMLTMKNKTWKRTEHSRNVDVKNLDLEGKNRKE